MSEESLRKSTPGGIQIVSVEEALHKDANKKLLSDNEKFIHDMA